MQIRVFARQAIGLEELQQTRDTRVCSSDQVRRMPQ